MRYPENEINPSFRESVYSLEGIFFSSHTELGNEYRKLVRHVKIILPDIRSMEKERNQSDKLTKVMGYE